MGNFTWTVSIPKKRGERERELAVPVQYVELLMLLAEVLAW